MAEQQSYDSQIVGSSPGWASLPSGLEQPTYTCVTLYNLVAAKRVIFLAGKVTEGLVESNGSLPPGSD